MSEPEELKFRVEIFYVDKDAMYKNPSLEQFGQFDEFYDALSYCYKGLPKWCEEHPERLITMVSIVHVDKNGFPKGAQSSIPINLRAMRFEVIIPFKQTPLSGYYDDVCLKFRDHVADFISGLENDNGGIGSPIVKDSFIQISSQHQDHYLQGDISYISQWQCDLKKKKEREDTEKFRELVKMNGMFGEKADSIIDLLINEIGIRDSDSLIQFLVDCVINKPTVNQKVKDAIQEPLMKWYFEKVLYK